MATQVGLTVVKRFTYRGDATEEYSNTYWLTGTVPADDTAWRALFDAMVVSEKQVYPSSVTVVRGYGYADNQGHFGPRPAGTEVSPSVWTRDLVAAAATVAGTLAVTSEIRCPGDAAVWVRWKTSRLNKGKAIYLRKYFHPAYAASAGAFDQIANAQRDALLLHAAKMWDGTFISGRKITAAGSTDVIVGANHSPYVTTRTLRRRGKRPGA